MGAEELALNVAAVTLLLWIVVNFYVVPGMLTQIHKRFLKGNQKDTADKKDKGWELSQKQSGLQFHCFL